MRFIDKIRFRVIPWAFEILLLAAFSSCKEEEPMDIADDRPDLYLTLSVMTNSNIQSRAGGDDDFEENGSDAENYLDIDNGDFRVILFDRYTYEFLMELKASDNWIKYPPTNVNGAVSYKMEIEIKFPEGEKFSETRLEQIRREGMYVMVIANCKGMNQSFDYESDNNKFGLTGKTDKITELWSNKLAYNFSYPLGANGTSWLPTLTESSKKLIPMFGYVLAPGFTQLTGGRYETSVVVPMQRAMAKIEVIDNLKQPGIAVSDVTMTQFNQVGRVIPDLTNNPTWDDIGTQVTASSLPDTPNTTDNSGNGLKFYHDTENKTWIAYVPEMALGVPSGVNTTTKIFDTGGTNINRPHLNVGISFGDGTTETYPVHFARYTSDTFEPTIPDDSWNHILRNHIYRFSINNVGVTTELELHVVPWKLDQDEVWDYTDHVTIGQELEWVKDSYESLGDDGRITLWIEEGKMLEGYFKIKTPINGRWYARLTPLDDARANAVTFVDEYGATLEPSFGEPPVCHEVSGVIEKESPAWIRIKPTYLGNEEMSAFKLEFFVENLGIWTKVPMVAGDGKSYDTYTIVRKGNKLNG